MKSLDLDRWIALMRDGSADARIDWGGVDLKAETVDLFGRRFNQLALNATAQGGQWRGTVAGKELDGNAAWDPQGRAKLVARMKTLAIPATSCRTPVRLKPASSCASCRRWISSRNSSSRTTSSSVASN